MTKNTQSHPFFAEQMEILQEAFNRASRLSEAKAVEPADFKVSVYDLLDIHKSETPTTKGQLWDRVKKYKARHGDDEVLVEICKLILRKEELEEMLQRGQNTPSEQQPPIPVDSEEPEPEPGNAPYGMAREKPPVNPGTGEVVT